MSLQRICIPLLLLLPVLPSLAADALIPGRVELYPTWSAVGLEIPYTGDDNHNAMAQFTWKLVGEKKERLGVDMTFDRKRRLIWASIWPLELDQKIELEITLSDPDSPDLKPLRAAVRTRAMQLEPVGRNYYVSPAGDDANPGTKEKPFRTLGHAAKQAQPGDGVLALSGTYPEGDLFTRLQGLAEKPIVFAAAPDAKPILDSSTAIPKNSGAWKDVGDGVFASAVAYPVCQPGYLARDGLRMFRCNSLAELKLDKDKIGRAWYHDEKTGKLYVRPGPKLDANQGAYNLARHVYALHLDGSKHVVVRGFTMRYYGNVAVRLSGGAQGCMIVDNIIHNVPGGFFLKNETTRDNAIWRNEIFEPGLADFPWGAIKESGYPRQGLYYAAGRGTSVCYNKIHGWFDCVCPESWRNPDKLELNRDGDVMFNELYNAGDDAIEADGGGVNLRLHGNRIRNCLAALSLAPVERGPVYVTRNDATFRGLMFKLNITGCTSLGWTYCYHNSGYCQTIGEDGGTAISFPPTIPCENKVFRNNAIICNEWAVRGGRTGFTLDGNCYWHVPGKPPRKFQWDKKSYTTIDAFRKATGQEKLGLYADPLFAATPDLGKYASSKEFLASRLADHPLVADTKSGDLRLKPGSACRDKGVLIRGINEDFAGKAPDIGAFEVR